jgi:hypothetical protein
MTNTIEEALTAAVQLMDDLLWMMEKEGTTRVLIFPEMRARIQEVRDDLTTITTYRPVSHVATTTGEFGDGR